VKSRRKKEDGEQARCAGRDQSAGHDSVEEWLWRANMPLLLRGDEEEDIDDDAMSDGSQAIDISDPDSD
jgi:hypothetical protein